MHATPIWISKRLCIGIDPNVFFPLDQEGDIRAKQICTFCPVKSPCLETALMNEERGIWGGTNEHDRDTIRVQRALTRSQAMRSAELLRDKQRELERPIYAYSASLSGISFQCNHTPPASEMNSEVLALFCV
jgi:WhiB family redox-sensing transcriptional regulator